MTKFNDSLKGVLKKARQVGDTKTGADGVTRVWTDLGNGKFDWRRMKKTAAGASASGTAKASRLNDPERVAKLKAFLTNTSDDKLKIFAEKEGNAPKLRLMAVAELEKRGVDVSDINLDNGKLGALKSAFGVDEDHDDTVDMTVDLDFTDDDLDEDWQNIDAIKNKLGMPLNDKKMTKKQRIELDDYIHQLKISQPKYKPPVDEIFDLNRTYAYFLESGLPLMIGSGGAGVGKSYNFHLVAEKGIGLRAFDPDEDENGDGDYDYVEAPEAGSVPQLLQILKDHNGKIILFDDADSILKENETLNILKKATASSGKRIVGKQSSNKATNFPPFEFTGQIVFLTNMSQYELTKDENLNAIYSRAVKKDIYFTKKEQLSFINRLRHKFDFTGISRLPDKKEDEAERDEVYQLIEDNINSIDPAKFNSRLMMEVLAKKRTVDSANKKYDDDPVLAQMLYGPKSNWQDEIQDLLIKGGLSKKDRLEEIEKAKKLLTL